MFTEPLMFAIIKYSVVAAPLKRCQYSMARPRTNLTAMTNWRGMLDVCQEQIFWECLRYLKYSS